MSADDFLDTNVFVYLFDEADEGKRQQGEMLVNAGISGIGLCRRIGGKSVSGDSHWSPELVAGPPVHGSTSSPRTGFD